MRLTKEIMKKLYIIGNGFDIHHGLKTRYSDYKAYLQQKDRQQVEDFDDFLECYDINKKNIQNWSDLEVYTRHIYCVDLYQILDKSIDCSESDMDRASYWHDIQYNSEEYSKWITGIRLNVNEWIRQIEYTNVTKDSNLPIDTNAIYINFNYTETLQSVYGVPDSNIFHIHGKVSNEIVFGNNCFPDDMIRSSIIRTDNKNEDDDWRISQAIDILNSRLEDAKCYYKKSDEIMLKHRSFFENIDECQELIIMGLSFGSEDLCYIHKIIEKGFNIQKITIFYRTKDDFYRFVKHLYMPLSDQVTVESRLW